MRSRGGGVGGCRRRGVRDAMTVALLEALPCHSAVTFGLPQPIRSLALSFDSRDPMLTVGTPALCSQLKHLSLASAGNTPFGSMLPARRLELYNFPPLIP